VVKQLNVTVRDGLDVVTKEKARTYACSSAKSLQYDVAHMFARDSAFASLTVRLDSGSDSAFASLTSIEICEDLDFALFCRSIAFRCPSCAALPFSLSTPFWDDN